MLRSYWVVLNVMAHASSFKKVTVRSLSFCTWTTGSTLLVCSLSLTLITAFIGFFLRSFLSYTALWVLHATVSLRIRSELLKKMRFRSNVSGSCIVVRYRGVSSFLPHDLVTEQKCLEFYDAVAPGFT